jgi:6-phosphogluconate dehydrogenase (decarboxylating)
MNLELEAYEGELQYLRKCLYDLDQLDIADVWHEGSNSFYRAFLLHPLPTQEVHGNPYG